MIFGEIFITISRRLGRIGLGIVIIGQLLGNPLFAQESEVDSSTVGNSGEIVTQLSSATQSGDFLHSLLALTDLALSQDSRSSMGALKQFLQIEESGVLSRQVNRFGKTLLTPRMLQLFDRIHQLLSQQSTEELQVAEILIRALVVKVAIRQSPDSTHDEELESIFDQAELLLKAFTQRSATSKYLVSAQGAIRDLDNLASLERFIAAENVMLSQNLPKPYPSVPFREIPLAYEVASDAFIDWFRTTSKSSDEAVLKIRADRLLSLMAGLNCDDAQFRERARLQLARLIKERLLIDVLKQRRVIDSYAAQAEMLRGLNFAVDYPDMLSDESMSKTVTEDARAQLAYLERRRHRLNSFMATKRGGSKARAEQAFVAAVDIARNHASPKRRTRARARLLQQLKSGNLNRFTVDTEPRTRHALLDYCTLELTQPSAKNSPAWVRKILRDATYNANQAHRANPLLLAAKITTDPLTQLRAFWLIEQLTFDSIPWAQSAIRPVFFELLHGSMMPNFLSRAAIHPSDTALVVFFEKMIERQLRTLSGSDSDAAVRSAKQLAERRSQLAQMRIKLERAQRSDQAAAVWSTEERELAARLRAIFAALNQQPVANVKITLINELAASLDPISYHFLYSPHVELSSLSLQAMNCLWLRAAPPAAPIRKQLQTVYAEGYISSRLAAAFDSQHPENYRLHCLLALLLISGDDDATYQNHATDILRDELSNPVSTNTLRHALTLLKPKAPNMQLLFAIHALRALDPLYINEEQQKLVLQAIDRLRTLIFSQDKFGHAFITQVFSLFSLWYQIPSARQALAFLCYDGLPFQYLQTGELHRLREAANIFVTTVLADKSLDARWRRVIADQYQEARKQSGDIPSNPELSTNLAKLLGDMLKIVLVLHTGPNYSSYPDATKQSLATLLTQLHIAAAKLMLWDPRLSIGMQFLRRAGIDGDSEVFQFYRTLVATHIFDDDKLERLAQLVQIDDEAQEAIVREVLRGSLTPRNVLPSYRTLPRLAATGVASLPMLQQQYLSLVTGYEKVCSQMPANTPWRDLIHRLTLPNLSK